jgi:hypothetical protein
MSNIGRQYSRVYWSGTALANAITQPDCEPRLPVSGNWRRRDGVTFTMITDMMKPNEFAIPDVFQAATPSLAYVVDDGIGSNTVTVAIQ